MNKSVRVIDETGKMLGIFNFVKAYDFAISRGYDLILVNNNDNIPIVKLADYSKLLYNQKKKQKENKKNQIVIKQKEIVFGLNIAENDFNTKINHLNLFLKDNCHVKITIKMEKRIAITNPQFGFDLANKIINIYKDNAIITQPKLINNIINFNIEPKK